MITIGSLFSGIGGFELGLERAIPNSQTIWQCEQDKYCKTVLQKHWPDAKMYTDITEMNTDEIERPDIICGGFPCQDISVAGKGVGIHGKKSGLWWEMHRIISDLRPRIAVLENVPAITFRGGREVLGSLAKIGYDAEWTVISARQFGAPHLRRRWFLVAYPNSSAARQMRNRQKQNKSTEGYKSDVLHKKRTTDTKRITKIDRLGHAAYPNSIRAQIQTERRQSAEQMLRSQSENRTFWQKWPAESPICRVDDGIPNRVARLKALGNAIVPQCSEYIGHCIVSSGLLEDIL